MSQSATAPTTAATYAKAQARKPSQPITQPKLQPNPGRNERQPAKHAPAQPNASLSQTKKAPGRSSTPIINWFQRKLAGTVKPNRRILNGGPDPQTRSNDNTMRGKSRVGTSGSKSTPRVASSPFPQPTLLTPPRTGRNEATIPTKRKTISLNGDDGQNSVDSDDGDRSTPRSSLARESTWSPTSNLEADEDASVRPLPPSSPPSPSPSLSASSYLSNPNTFRSIAASTKPTTLLSIDLTPNGVAHIAQAPNTPLSHIPRFPHVRSSSAGTSGGVVGSGASITFSALPPQSSSRPSSLNNINPNSSSIANANGHVQAPLHTAHHPRNNPRPSSPPQDNASMLTLASSAFAMPGGRIGVAIPGWNPGTPSAMAGDSISHFGGSIIGDGEGDISSQYVLGDDGRLDVDGERDIDASIRALRPRSSRRGSWDSEASDWSAPVGAGMSTGTPSRSVWTTNSNRTGGQFSVGSEGRNEKSEGGFVDDVDNHSLEHPTPISPADPLPIANEDGQRSSEKSSPPIGVETTPKKKGGDLGPSLQESSAGVPLPEQQ